MAKAQAYQSTEWNFRACPENELRLCLHYELAREIENWREVVQKFRRAVPSIGLASREYFPARTAQARFLTPFEFGLNNPHLDLLVKFSDWPDRPWLSLDAVKRKELTTTPTEANWMALFCEGKYLSQGNDKVLQPNVTVGEAEKQITYTALKIDWSKTDAQLKKEFAAWLAHWRSFIKTKPREKRGGQNPRDILKKLGAYRLLKVMDWEKAAEFTAKHLNGELYGDQSSWLRAKREAEDALKIFSETKNLDAVLGKVNDQ